VKCPVNGHAEPGKDSRKDETDSDEFMEDKAQTESQPDTIHRYQFRLFGCPSRARHGRSPGGRAQVDPANLGDVSMAEEIPELPTLENGESSSAQIAPAKPIDLTLTFSLRLVLHKFIAISFVFSAVLPGLGMAVHRAYPRSYG
jgi:hypothetical protein